MWSKKTLVSVIVAGWIGISGVVGVAAQETPTEPPPPAAGTRADPLPIGTSGAIRPDWQLRVVSVEQNGDETVRRASSYNDPPKPGRQFVIITIAVTYTGPDSASLYGGMGLSVVGPAGLEYDGYDHDCELATLDDDLSSGEVFTNGTATGTICRDVPIDEAGELTLFDRATLSSGRTFFSLKS